MLLRVAPLYLAYVVLLSLWPWNDGLDVATFRRSGEYLDFSALPEQVELLRELEYLAAATLGGYLLSESAGYLCGSVIFIDGGTEAAVRHGDSPAPKALV